MPAKVAKTYRYTLRHPGVCAEFYFPKRVAYQEEIVKALKEGVQEFTVKNYLKGCASELLTELADYPSVLDPRRYEGRKTETISVADVKKRIEMFKNPFFGWSTHSVEGAFLNTYVEPPVLQDELTQIIRVIHRFDSELASSKKKGVRTSGAEHHFVAADELPPPDCIASLWRHAYPAVPWRTSIFFGTGNHLH